MKQDKLKLIQEDLKRHKELFEYDYGTTSKRSGRGNYNNNEVISEEEPEEENPIPSKEGGNDNPDFDFDKPSNIEEPSDNKPEEDLGTSDEFSAADEIESVESNDVEEVDVTDIISRTDDAKNSADRAVASSEENKTLLKDLSTKLVNFEKYLTKIDDVISRVTKLQQDIKSPEEKLELRSLDSYPFNLKLTDFWNDKLNDTTHNYKVTNGDVEEKELTLTKDDIVNYSPDEIKRSFTDNK